MEERKKTRREENIREKNRKIRVEEKREPRRRKRLSMCGLAQKVFGSLGGLCNHIKFRRGHVAAAFLHAAKLMGCKGFEGSGVKFMFKEGIEYYNIGICAANM